MCPVTSTLWRGRLNHYTSVSSCAYNSSPLDLERMEALRADPTFRGKLPPPEKVGGANDFACARWKRASTSQLAERHGMLPSMYPYCICFYARQVVVKDCDWIACNIPWHRSRAGGCGWCTSRDWTSTPVEV